jgi:hypothetical protein
MSSWWLVFGRFVTVLSLLSSVLTQILPKRGKRRNRCGARRFGRGTRLYALDPCQSVPCPSMGMHWIHAPPAGEEQGTKQEVWAGEQGRCHSLPLEVCMRALNAHARGSLKPPALRSDLFPPLPLARASTHRVLQTVLFCVQPFLRVHGNACTFFPARAVKKKPSHG